MKKVCLTGATGFVGSHLKKIMEAQGWMIRPLARTDFSAGVEHLKETLRGCNAVVHLAGTPIAQRWSAMVKQEIYSSRILTTRALSKAICDIEEPPSVFVSASAVGIYDGFGIHDENSTALAEDFLGKLCKDWEAEAQAAKICTRVVNPRIGLVLGRDGGFLARQLPVFRLGLGGPIASGKQGFPFIHLHDLCYALIFVIENHEIHGPVNMVAPELVDNKHFAKTLGKLLNKPSFLPVPGLALKLLFGEGAEAIVSGQFVNPSKLLTFGFQFKFSTLKDALADVISKSC